MTYTDHRPRVGIYRNRREAELEVAAFMARVICILNGLFDVALQDLGGMTPLEKASTPTLDQLAQEGEWLRVRPASGTRMETALLDFLGGDEDGETILAGPLEALSLGRRLSEDEMAYSLRFVACGEAVVVDVGDHLLNDSECRTLCAALSGEMRELWPLGGARALLIVPRQFQGGAPSIDAVEALGHSYVDLAPDPGLRPLLVEMGQQLQSHSINDLRLDLEEDLINGCLLYAGGWKQEWRSRYLQPHGMSCFSVDPLVQGVVRGLGMDLIQLPKEHRRFSYIKSLMGRLDEYLELGKDFLFDIPYLWQSTYKGDLLEKIKTIEWLDKHWLDPLWQSCKKGGHELYVLALRPTDIRVGAMREGDSLAARWPPLAMNQASPSLSEAILGQEADSASIVALGDLCRSESAVVTDL